MLRFVLVVPTALAVLAFAASGQSETPQVSQADDNNVARSTGDSVWKPLLLEGHELHLSLKTERADEPIRHMPPGMTLPRNPYTSANPEFVEAVARSTSMGRIPRDGVHSAFYASYRGENRLVLFRGLEAVSALDADWREAALRKIWAHNESLGRARVHRRGLLLIVVWHEGLSTQQWAALNARVAQQIDN